MSERSNELRYLREELEPLAKSDAVLDRMLRTGRPLTRETWIAMNWPEGAPGMTAELEEQVPEPLRADVQRSVPAARD